MTPTQFVEGPSFATAFYGAAVGPTPCGGAQFFRFDFIHIEVRGTASGLRSVMTLVGTFAEHFAPIVTDLLDALLVNGAPPITELKVMPVSHDHGSNLSLQPGVMDRTEGIDGGGIRPHIRLCG